MAKIIVCVYLPSKDTVEKANPAHSCESNFLARPFAYSRVFWDTVGRLISWSKFNHNFFVCLRIQTIKSDSDLWPTFDVGLKYWVSDLLNCFTTCIFAIEIYIKMRWVMVQSMNKYSHAESTRSMYCSTLQVYDIILSYVYRR